MQKFITEQLPVLLNRSLKARNVIFAISLFLSVAFYNIIISEYSINDNVLPLFTKPKQYNFFSGSKGGTYIVIGDEIRKGLFEQSNISINVENTKGGSENAIKVLTNDRSFGIVQEETIHKSDFIRNQLRYITPLYIERMHILYNSKTVKIGENAKLSAPTSKALLNALNESKITIGPVGSGTRIIANYIICEINKQAGKDLKLDIQSHLMNESFNLLEKGELDMMFVIGGAPNKRINELLSKKHIKLLSIDPSFISTVNSEHNINLRLTDFYGKYGENYNNVSTIGSYAWLIASKDILNSEILKVLKVLNAVKPNINSIINANLENSPLNEFDSLSYFKKGNDLSKRRIARKVILFLVSVTISSFLILVFLTGLISKYKQSNYFRAITAVIKEHGPINTKLDEDNETYTTPIISKNQTTIINKLVGGIRKLIIIRSEINEEYEAGGLSEAHYTFLKENIDRIKDSLKKLLALRFNEVIEAHNHFTIDMLRPFCTSDYIHLDDYECLLKKLNETKE